MKYCYLIIFMTFSIASFGQSILGQWQTYDDETNKKKGIVEIYKEGDFYFARIVKSYVSKDNAVCKACNGKNKGKLIKGLVILENLEKDGDEYNEGTILDPENGQTYSCYIEQIENDKLKVRGYLGFSVFGRTQYWDRIK